MKNIILTLVALFVVADIATAQINVPLYNVGFKQPAGTLNFVLKDWAGGSAGGGSNARRWSPIDTTSWLSLTDLRPGDTLLIAWAACNATTPYNMAISVQFANEDAIKPAFVIDTLARIGSALAAAAAGLTTADSLFQGRSVYHDWIVNNPGATKMRMLISKDTTAAAVDNLGTNSSTTALIRAGVLRQPRKD